MNQKLENSQKDLQRANDYDLYLSLLVKRESVLNTIKTSKNQFVKRDRYKQVVKLNNQINGLKRKWGFKE
jgi:hypothetical protein